MASSAPKTILSIGLGPAHALSKLEGDQIKNDLQAQVEEARELGFEVTILFPDTKDPNVIEDLRQKLRSQHFDGVSIGFGVRGNIELTDLFEKLVNAVIEEVKPAPKMMFSTRPSGVVEAIQRVF